MSAAFDAAAFDDLSLDALRARRSAKWATYPADVLPAWIAEMDFPLAVPVRETLRAAIDADDAGYPQPARLGEAFAGFASRRFGWAVDPAAVRLLPDVMIGVAEVLRVVTAPGERVVINPPVYSPFRSTIAELGRTVVEVPLAEEDGWMLDFDALEQAFAAGARAYLLCNPHNPTGRVLSREALERIAGLSAQYDVAVVADEIHAPLALAGATHVPFTALGEDLARRAVTLTSASKAWNLAGLKCAVLVPGSAAMAAELERLPPSLRYHAGHLGVLGSIAAFESGESWLDELVAYLDANRLLLGRLLAEHLPDVGYVPPEAGYLAWLDCRRLALGDDPAAAFLERGRVALSSGPSFGEQGSGFARLNFGTSAAILTEAVERMAAALATTA